MSFALGKAEKPTSQVLSELSAESGRHVRFAERMSLSQLSQPARAPAVERALVAIAALDSSPLRSTPQSHFRELQEAFAALGDRERVVASAFTDRALRILTDRDAPDHVQLKYLWGLVATAAPDTVVSLFRVINETAHVRSASVLRDAALALSCHKSPTSRPLVLRSAAALDRNTRSEEHREAIVSGLASGVVLRTAHLISIAVATGSFPKNDASPTGRYHHVALMKEMIAESGCAALRHRVIDEIASMTNPFYLWNHPLMPPTLNASTMLRMPPFLIDVVRIALDSFDPIAQRKGVLAVLPTYREGSGGEGEVVTDVLAHRIGGPAARAEVEEFLRHLPKGHVKKVRAEARRRQRA